MNTASSPLRVALLGTGWVGREYVRACRDSPNFELAGAYNRTRERAESVLAEFGVKARIYEDETSALSDPDVDVVISATTPDRRRDHVVTAALNKKHVIAEKPLGLSAESIADMVRAVRESGVKSMTSFVLRFNEQIQTSKRLVESGQIGDIVYAEADYWNPSRPEWPGYYWLTKKDPGGSAFITGGCHAVDVLRYFVGDISSVSATGAPISPGHEYSPAVVATVNFASGAIGKVSAVLEGVIPYHFNTRLIGTRGSVDGNRVWLPDLLPGAVAPFTYDTIPPDTAEVSHHPFTTALDHFHDCITSGTESHASIPNAAHSMAAVFAVDASLADGGSSVRPSDVLDLANL